MTAGCTIAVGNSAGVPIKVSEPARLADGTLSNCLPHAVYYSAADNAMIRLFGSGKPYLGVGRFVPELRVDGANACGFTHLYPEDHADAFFVLIPQANTRGTTLHGEPSLKPNGEPTTLGYFRPRVIYQLTRSGSRWLATQTGDSFPAIDVASGKGGRQIIRNLTISDGQYTSAVSGYSVVEDVRISGSSRNLVNVGDLELSMRTPVLANTCARNVHVSCLYGDNPNSIVAASASFTLLNVENVPAARIRGTPGAARGTVIGGVTMVAGLGKLRMRGVYRASTSATIISYSSGFAEIDSDHATEFKDVNSPSMGAGGYFEFNATYRHLGVKSGDAVL